MSEQKTSLDLDAIEARGMSPWCNECGEPRHKCACDEQPSDGQLIVAIVAEMRRLLATLDERDKQIADIRADRSDVLRENDHLRAFLARKKGLLLEYQDYRDGIKAAE